VQNSFERVQKNIRAGKLTAHIEDINYLRGKGYFSFRRYARVGLVVLYRLFVVARLWTHKQIPASTAALTQSRHWRKTLL